MAAKNFLPVYQFLTAQSMTGDITSSALNIQYLDNIAIQLNVTGTPTGTFTVQGSLDYDQSIPNNSTRTGNWANITTSPASLAVSGSAVTLLATINQAPFPWIRVVYTHGSSTGTVTAFICAKGI